MRSAAAVLGVAVVVLTGCGGGGSNSTAAISTASSANGELSSQFITPKGNNDIAEFGHEATVAEREAASAVLEKSLRARASADWVMQCSTLTPKAMESFESRPEDGDFKPGCPKALKAFAEPLSKSKEVRANTLSGPITALRVKGNQGYALYHGNDGTDYAMPLAKESGAWKVAAVVTIEIG